MGEQFSKFDPAEALDSPEAIEIFMADAFATGDAQHIAAALGEVARAKGVEMLAAQTGLSGEDLLHSLRTNGDPSLKTTLAVMKALGMQMAVASHANAD